MQMMNMKNCKIIMDKMVKVLKNSREEDTKQLTRYFSLANKQLQENCLNMTSSDVFGIVGGSLAIKESYENKFGLFVPMSTPVIGIVN